MLEAGSVSISLFGGVLAVSARPPTDQRKQKDASKALALAIHGGGVGV